MRREDYLWVVRSFHLQHSFINSTLMTLLPFKTFHDPVGTSLSKPLAPTNISAGNKWVSHSGSTYLMWTCLSLHLNTYSQGIGLGLMSRVTTESFALQPFFFSHTRVTRCFEAATPGQSQFSPFGSPQVGSVWEQKSSSNTLLTQAYSKHIYWAPILCWALGEVLGSPSHRHIFSVLLSV